MNFEGVIGLEIHVGMKTKTKMFSSAPVSFGKEPNTMVAPFDMAFPGSMPTVNKQAVINAIRVCHALKMEIDNELWFDRKNYFYSDLPKGYQITQKRRPIGKSGSLTINTSSGIKTIRLERLQIEEDACKQIHYKDYTLIDYNRAGIPLLEIVSYPDFRSGEEAMRFVEKIRSIVTFLNVSSGKMEEGSLRCDVNVSVRPIGSKEYGKVVEIKNINTLNNIQRAIDFEIERQTKILLKGEVVKKETRRFDENKKETVLMRNKTDDVDYKYFTEPNIAPIKLSKEFIDEAIQSSPALAEERKVKYLAMGLSEYNSNLLLTSKETSDYFEEVVGQGVKPELAANWINVQIQTLLKKNNQTIENFQIQPKELAKLLRQLDKGAINNKQAREIFNEMIVTGKSFNEIDNKVVLLSNESELLAIIDQVLDNSPRLVTDFKNGKDKVVGYIVGQIMKDTRGSANPEVTNKLVVRRLKEKM